ncbi:MAG TPA: hypothetical protein VMP12_05545 [Candidatus Sulfotelmatobacter sp.]|nr:hypothetical protein [Candidatus Sulfotelmatobacter sp.]
MQIDANLDRQHDHVGAQHAAPQFARTSTGRRFSASIQSLKPKVSQSDALQKFSSFRPATFLRTLCIGPLQRIAQVYVPFHLYRVDYDLGREHQARLFAIDAVEGSLDLFEFPTLPRQDELTQVETRNALPTNLTDDAVQECLREKVLRVIFQQGFFRLRDANLTLQRVPLDLHFAYWLALYGNNTVRCRVLDATRGKIEGAKASTLFESWLSV